mmetsp:Transcript_5244/g.14144  ORF Transcript_5244/g.14144 Transcript_5244/m.14144 type:complete len:215 (+) Transcript_5244:1683-2327(+)
MVQGNPKNNTVQQSNRATDHPLENIDFVAQFIEKERRHAVQNDALERVIDGHIAAFLDLLGMRLDAAKDGLGLGHGRSSNGVRLDLHFGHESHGSVAQDLDGVVLFEDIVLRLVPQQVGMQRRSGRVAAGGLVQRALVLCLGCRCLCRCCCCGGCRSGCCLVAATCRRGLLHLLFGCQAVAHLSSFSSFSSSLSLACACYSALCAALQYQYGGI